MSSPLGGLPRPPLFSTLGDFVATWAGWFTVAQRILFATSSSGTSAQRPNASYIGQIYFDTTLTKPIWAKTLGASTMWVDATGTGV